MPQSDQQYILEDLSTGDEQIAHHLIFDTKLPECLRCKAMFTPDGNKVLTFLGLDIL